MTDLSPSEILTAAAKLLRERATAATPGPWDSNGDTEIYTTAEADTTTLWIGGTEKFGDSGTGEANAAWIALVHPGVGLALADWLEATALDPDLEREHDGCDRQICASAAALAVARQLLGGES